VLRPTPLRGFVGRHVGARLSCPLPLRERAQWCAHELERVRGSCDTHPLTHHHAWQHRAALSRGGRGHCNEHRACAHISRCQTAHLVPAAHVCARGLQLCFAHPNRGWAERRETFGCSAEHPWGVSCASKTRVNALMTRYARRLRGALRPMTRDARLSALHRGDFGLPGPRFRLLGRPPSYNGGQLPCGSVQRAPRTQVVVPGGRGPCLPRRTVTSRRRRTPLPAPPSGSSPETPLNERGCECI
jgi:hypothetical protein